MVFTFTKYTTIINKKEILILIFFINKPMPATCVGFLFFSPWFFIWTGHWFWLHWFWIHWFWIHGFGFMVLDSLICSLDLPHHSQSRVLRTLFRCFAAQIAHYVASYVVSQLHMYITSCLQASLTQLVIYICRADSNIFIKY